MWCCCKVLLVNVLRIMCVLTLPGGSQGKHTRMTGIRFFYYICIGIMEQGNPVEVRNCARSGNPRNAPTLCHCGIML